MISLREARELVTQRYLSPELAGQFIVEWRNDKNEPVRWQYEHVQNYSGLSTDTALKRFWRPAGLSINWEESRAARTVEPVARAPGGMAPAGIVRWVSHGIPTRPSGQLGSSHNFFVYGIRLAREDIERRLGRYDEPASVAEPAPPSSASVAEPAPPSSTSVAEPRMSPKDWFAGARLQHPQRRREGKMDYARRLHGLMENAPVTQVWPLMTLRRRLDDPPSDDPSS
jgi:hypothetical protein